MMEFGEMPTTALLLAWSWVPLSLFGMHFDIVRVKYDRFWKLPFHGSAYWFVMCVRNKCVFFQIHLFALVFQLEAFKLEFQWTTGHAKITNCVLHRTSNLADAAPVTEETYSVNEYCKYTVMNGPGSVVGIATAYGLDGPEIESRWGPDFPHLSRPALSPTQPPVSYNGYRSFPGVRCGRGVTLTPHPLLVPRSKLE